MKYKTVVEELDRYEARLADAVTDLAHGLKNANGEIFEDVLDEIADRFGPEVAHQCKKRCLQ